MTDTTTTTPAQTPETPPQTKEKKGGKTALIIIIILGVIALLCCGVSVLLLKGTSFMGNKVKDSISENLAEEFAEFALSGEGVDVDIDSDNETITWETEDGTGRIGGSQTWPDDIPSTVPVFSYGTIETSMKFTEGGSQTWSISFNDTARQAHDSYTRDLENKGWTITSTYTSGTTHIVSAEKDTSSIFFTCEFEQNYCSLTVDTE